MALLSVHLWSSKDSNLHLTLQVHSHEQRSTPLMHELCRKAETQANSDKLHSKYAPWKVVTSTWESA